MSGKISGKKKEMTGDFSITLRDVFSVLTGKDCSTYGRLLQYLRKSTGKQYGKPDKNNISQAVFKWIKDNLRNGIINKGFTFP